MEVENPSAHASAGPEPGLSEAVAASNPTISDPSPASASASSDTHGANGVDHEEQKVAVNTASPIYSVLIELMKEKHATEWFGVPVDPVVLNIPTYFTIIKHPMDLGTIKKRIEGGSHYHSEDEVVADVNLTFNNATTFNPVTNAVHTVAKKLQKKFDTLLTKSRNSSTAAAAARKRGRKPGPAETAAGAHDSEGPHRKRQAVPAAPIAADVKTNAHDNGVSAVAPLPVTPSPVGDGKFDADACSRILDSIISHDCSGPFLAPVDPVALEIPEYLEVVKIPMDLGTVKKKLRAGSYRSNEHFASDMRLIWDNCILFNGLDKGVSRMARQLQQKFDRLYSKLLPQ